VRGPRVAATLIVRDEARHLPDCLASLAGRIDEIVVVDTGSTDASRALAVAAGARVLDFRWTGDFAAARNAAADAARADWLLYIDADERVVAWDANAIARAHARPEVAALRVLFRPKSGYSRYRELRLFRNRPDLRFRGAIHESLVPALTELEASEGARVEPADIALDHLGYDGDLAAKHRRNLPLLEARLAREPDHVYCLDHLGATLAAMGDAAGAEDAWRRGVDAVRARGAREIADVMPFIHLANALVARGSPEARALVDEARARFRDDHALAWIDAKLRLDAGDAAGAYPLFAALAGVDPEADTDGPAFDLSIFGARAHAAAGLCALRLGDDAAAATHYARAEALEPGVAEHRVKRMYAEARARDRRAD
jgi:hypothetical protein